MKNERQQQVVVVVVAMEKMAVVSVGTTITTRFYHPDLAVVPVTAKIKIGRPLDEEAKKIPQEVKDLISTKTLD